MLKVDPILLQSVHRKLRQQTDLNDQIRRGPRRVQIAKTGVDNFESKLDEAKKELTRLKMAADDKQLQLQTREAKIEDLKTKRNSCGSNREFSLLNEQIAADEQANSVQSDEIFEVLEKIDEQENTVKQASEHLQLAQKELIKVESDVDQRLTTLNSELDRITDELSAKEKELPGEVVREYKWRVEKLGEDALAPLDGDVCGRCSQTQSPNQLSFVTTGKSVFCSGCNAILYQPQTETSASS